ncbi:MAG: hypothetical protein MZV63_23015 [Marinilabiliales bacterium]|nr:hypothetical protein [Marinilabiliales bacterium]
MRLSATTPLLWRTKSAAGRKATATEAFSRLPPEEKDAPGHCTGGHLCQAERHQPGSRCSCKADTAPQGAPGGICDNNKGW